MAIKKSPADDLPQNQISSDPLDPFEASKKTAPKSFAPSIPLVVEEKVPSDVAIKKLPADDFLQNQISSDPLNPFEASKKTAPESFAPTIPLAVDEKFPNDVAIKKSPTEYLPQNQISSALTISPHLQNPDARLSSTSLPSSSSPLPPPSPLSSLPPSSSSKLSNEPADECNWIGLAGRVTEFLTNHERAEKLLAQLKKDIASNPKTFVVDMIDCLTKIHEDSCELLNYAKKLEKKFSTENIALNTGGKISVKHDLGKRKKIVTENERRYLIALGSFQPKLSIFLVNKNIPANKQCRMRSAWYSEYPPLENSLEKDAAFCFVCSLFPENFVRSCSNQECVSEGVRQWHKMKSRGAKDRRKLITHFSSEAHRAALSDFCHFNNEGTHVDILLDKSIREKKIAEEREKEYHRKVIEILVDVTKSLGRQGFAFRGHDSFEKEIDGNFMQVVHLISRHCHIMKKWLDEIDLLGSQTRGAILKEIEEADFLSVMGDTTPDSSHKDRFAISIRYVRKSTEGPVPVERLLKMDAVLTKKNGEELAEKMFTAFNSLSIQVKKLVLQSYDFARNMSGEYNGVQQKLSEKCNKKILYVPCQPHRINIFVETSCTASSIIKEFFDTLHALYVFFAGSTKRFQSLTEELKTIENALSLKNLSQTRWTARAESIKAVWIVTLLLFS